MMFLPDALKAFPRVLTLLPAHFAAS